MKKVFSLFMAIVMLFTLTAGIDFSANATNIRQVEFTGEYGQTEARTILKSINDFRTGSEAWYWDETDTNKVYCDNLQALEYNYELEKVAMQRAAEIAALYSHTRPNGDDCFSVYDEFGIDWMAVGENIAYGYLTADSVNDAWREDNELYDGQGHRRNMLSSKFNAVGIGHFYFKGRHFWVEEFAYLSTQSVSTPANDSQTKVTVDVSDENYDTVIRNTELEHTWDSGVHVTDVTCTKNGVMIYTCLTCHKERAEVIPAIGHNYFEESVQNPTCAEKGYRIKQCQNCGDTYTESIPALDHDFSNNAEYCRNNCGTKNPDYVAPEEPTTKPADTTKPTESTTKPVETTKPTQPTTKPTQATTKPTTQPTTKPTQATTQPTTKPVTEPTTKPVTEAPTEKPTEAPTASTTQPTEKPSQVPTQKPTVPITHPSTTAPSTTQNTTTTVKVTQKETTTAKEKPPVKGVKKVSGEWVNKKQKNASVKKLKKAKKSLKVYWKRVSGVKGYQIQYSTSKKFTKKTTKKVTVKGNKATSKTIKKLRGGKKYYIRVRTYKTYKVNKKTVNVYSKWSKPKAVTIKK